MHRRIKFSKKMKERRKRGRILVSISVCFIICIAMLYSCGANGTGNAIEKDVDLEGYTTVKDGTLSVGVELGYPPMEYFDEDGITPIGFDVEMAKALAGEMGLELDLINMSWDGIFSGLEEGRYDVVISSVSKTKDREEQLLLSEPYIANSLVLLVPKDSEIGDIKDLEGKSVAMQTESTADYLIQKYKEDGLNTNNKRFGKIAGAFKDFKDGLSDSLCTDSVVAAYYLGDSIDEYITAWKSYEEEPLCMAFKKDNESMKLAVEEALSTIRNNGRLAEIAKKYFGDESVINVR